MTAQGPGVAGVDGMIEADECAQDVIDAIKKERPETLKGDLLKSIYVTSTMGVSYKVNS